MGLGKQAKILSPQQVKAVAAYLRSRRNGLRNQTIFYLSVKAGLRAKEIAAFKWSMVLGADGNLSDAIHLTNEATKGRSGRVIPLNKDLWACLSQMLKTAQNNKRFDHRTAYVITTERSAHTSAQTIVTMFHRWYRDLGLIGCSSHSGRRTFITNAARKIGSVGGSLRDVQALAGHSSLSVTQRYIEGDERARARIVDLI